MSTLVQRLGLQKCTETTALLLQKQKKAEEKQPLKPNDPLHTASKAKLKSALKQIWQSEKKARLELDKIKNKKHSEWSASAKTYTPVWKL